MKARVVDTSGGEVWVEMADGDDVSRFQEGDDVVIVLAEEEPDLARVMAATSEAHRAARFHDELRSGDGSHAEGRALDLLRGDHEDRD